MIARRRWGWDSFVTFPAIGGLVLGLIGISRGFYGQIGITAGPLGFVLGVAVGAAAAILRFRIATFLLSLLASAVVLSAATLYWSLPEDRWQGLLEWEASSVSPPDILPTLLGLRVLQDVPPQFRGFVGP